MEHVPEQPHVQLSTSHTHINVVFRDRPGEVGHVSVLRKQSHERGEPERAWPCAVDTSTLIIVQRFGHRKGHLSMAIP